ncbi:alpha-L-fucosidase [Mucilaginibacter sp. SG564]|uniref:alpha-L-fucosidase n=1 Tax=unclassified Mucilaginibacter TaxID=2617802 RepID=UPI001552B6C3|nr:alpha-L-fucosidase [Mucilaginibacter sp. SG564]NOW98055.1 alpha-L-fucosidase [Mucilaginibacter sp. SG564]
MKKIITAFSIMLVFSMAGFAQSSYIPSKSNLENREWFNNAKLGLFIHYGIYSQLDDVDEAWAMRKYTVPQYEKIADQFDPRDFNAKEWVAAAKKLGFKYITVTTKHHDGFCLFDSKYTDWTIMHHGKKRLDIIKALADECHKQGIKLWLYYSLLDWHHPDFVFRKDEGGTYKHQLPNPNRDEQKYIQYMKNQLTELLTKYGTVAGIWFDGYWSKDVGRYPFGEIYKLIHQLQPACMIINNHDMFYIPGEDAMVYALYDPFPQSAYDSDIRLKQMPLQAMDMSSNKWGYYSKQIYKPVDTLIHNMEKVAGKHASFVLNTGPLPNGKLDEHFIDTIKVVNKRMSIHK